MSLNEIRIRNIPPEMIDELKELSKKHNTVTSKYVLNILTEHLKTEKGTYVTGPINTKGLYLILSDSEKEKLVKDANAHGLDVKNYLHDLISRKSFVNVVPSVYDIQPYLDKTNEIVVLINGLITVIIRSGKVYDHEIEKVKELLEELVMISRKVYLEERSNRSKLYKKSKKLLYESIKENNVRNIQKEKR